MWKKPSVTKITLEPYVTCQKCNGVTLSGVNLEAILAEIKNQGKPSSTSK